MMELDETDRAIVGRLQYNGRMPFTDIAAEIGISEGSVRRRVKRLIDAGGLQIIGVVDPHLLDWQGAAIVGVKVRPGQVDAVADQIGTFPEVSYLFMASGRFDLFVEVFCRDQAHLVSFLTRELQLVPGVDQTETFMMLKLYKLSYRWGEAEPPRVMP